jgi:hypothetical protein
MGWRYRSGREDSIDFRHLKWSKAEKKAARRAFGAAYQKECATIAAKVQEMIEAASRPRVLIPKTHTAQSCEASISGPHAATRS